MATTYKNGFHKERLPGSEATITTDSMPVQYRGYQIYERAKFSFDIVKDGVRIGNMGTLAGAKTFVDAKKVN